MTMNESIDYLHEVFGWMSVTKPDFGGSVPLKRRFDASKKDELKKYKGRTLTLMGHG
jgi:hypothetical protein